MIKVRLAVEPKNFVELVQKPGKKFIATNPEPTQKQWKQNNYWVRIAKDIHRTYSGVCAYYCQYIPKVTGSKTIEHFKPKSKHPNQAYIWSNYRLVCGMMNGRKGNNEDVLDPFDIEDDWFIINFNTYMVEPSELVDTQTKSRIDKTIRRLNLNDDECVEGRMEALERFADRGDIKYLDFWVPFIAKELRRQELVDVVLSRFKSYL